MTENPGTCFTDPSRRIEDGEMCAILRAPKVSVVETQEAIQLRFEVVRARKEEERLSAALASSERAREETEGAMRADDNRLRDAAIRVWGEHIRGCDTPDEMAELILSLRNALAAERAKREEAESDRDRLTRQHAECDATIRTLTSKALAAVRGQETAEARAERLAGGLAGLIAAYEARRSPGGIVSYSSDPVRECVWTVALDTLEREARP